MGGAQVKKTPAGQWRKETCFPLFPLRLVSCGKALVGTQNGSPLPTQVVPQMAQARVTPQTCCSQVFPTNLESDDSHCIWRVGFLQALPKSFLFPHIMPQLLPRALTFLPWLHPQHSRLRLSHVRPNNIMLFLCAFKSEIALGLSLHSALASLPSRTTSQAFLFPCEKGVGTDPGSLLLAALLCPSQLGGGGWPAACVLSSEVPGRPPSSCSTFSLEAVGPAVLLLFLSSSCPERGQFGGPSDVVLPVKEQMSVWPSPLLRQKRKLCGLVVVRSLTGCS